MGLFAAKAELISKQKANTIFIVMEALVCVKGGSKELLGEASIEQVGPRFNVSFRIAFSLGGSLVDDRLLAMDIQPLKKIEPICESLWLANQRALVSIF